MCLAEPGRVASTDGSTARVVTRAGTRDSSLTVMNAHGESVAVGDWVIVSLGLVLRRVSSDSARILFEELRLLHDDGAADVG